MRFVYDRRGSGSPLLLLHGIGHRWQAWEPVLDRLAQNHDVIAVDLPGFGASPPIPEGRTYDIDTTLELLLELYGELGIERPHIAGNSLGGTLALEMAARGEVRSATALSPAGFWTPGERSWALFALRSLRTSAHGPESLQRLIAERKWLRGIGGAILYGHPTWQTPENTRDDLRALANAPGFDEVVDTGRTYTYTETTLRTPTAIAWGTRDRILLPRQAERAARQLPDAWHVSLPGCGHVPMTDAPSLVANTILRTCESAESAPGESGERAGTQTKEILE